MCECVGKSSVSVHRVSVRESLRFLVDLRIQHVTSIPFIKEKLDLHDVYWRLLPKPLKLCLVCWYCDCVLLP